MNEPGTEKTFEIAYASSGVGRYKRVRALYYQFDKEWVIFKNSQHKIVLAVNSSLVEHIEEVHPA